MSKKIFNPNDWQAQTKPQPTYTPVQNTSLSSNDDIEAIPQRIESTSTDIAPNYADWRDLGFALADALGESGRSYFHRLSRFYSGYTENETDKQFDNCQKSNGHGVTIKTLFHLAKQANVNISTHVQAIPSVSNETSKSPISSNSPSGDIEDLENNAPETMPTFSDEIKDNLPDFLQQVVAKSNSPEDADLLLLGSITAISSCLPNIYGIYAEREIFPNLFLFVTAQASAGKGRLTLCRKLVEPVHRQLRDRYKAEYDDFKRRQAEYVANKKDRDAEQPEEPPLRTLIIPANSSATAVFQILNDNQGVGLMFETEGDTLAQTFKSEHGNYSDGFRKAFHHETISYNRRKDREVVELNVPKLSAVLSGTPRQIQSLIPDAENGLFSRFIFYYMNVRPVWNDVFANSSDQTLDSYFNHLGMQFFDLYKHLEYQSEPIRFCLTSGQQQAFNAYFAQTQNQYLCLYGADYLATVRRLGLITFRMAMILTALRIMDDGDIHSPLVCRDNDFNTSLSMVKILVLHAAQVFQQLPSEAVTTAPKNQKQQFLDELPKEFCRKDYLTVANKLGIPDKTAEKHIKRFAVNGLINHYAHDKYKKP